MPGDQAAQLLRQAARQRQRAVDQLLEAPDVGVDLERPLDRFRQRRDRRAQRLAGPRDQLGSSPRVRPSTMMWMPPFGTLAICRIAAIVPIGRRSPGSGSSLSVVCSDEEQQPIAAQRAVDRLDRHRPVDRERLQREREDDRLAERERPEARSGRCVSGSVAMIQPSGWHADHGASNDMRRLDRSCTNFSAWR